MSSVHTFLATVLLVSLTQGVPYSSLVKSPALSPASKAAVTNIHKLSHIIEPKSYHINLTVDLDAEKFSFNGTSVIKLEFKGIAKNITFHVKDLELNSSSYLRCDDGIISNLAYTLKDDMCTFMLKKNVKIGSICDFEIAYKGGDNGENKGFYRTSYTNKNGKKKWMASTHLEPIAARQVFPCWDEPSFKATFKISIKHNRKYKAISNMREEAEIVDTTNSTLKTTHFAESPKMSPYLVAFAIGEFISVDEDNQDFQVITRKDVFNSGEYALNIGPSILKALDNYTGFSYKDHKLMKMDSLAVPELPAGAMENWGLVIYSEKEFLYTENVSTTLQKENVVGIIAHELAHQWFGNLVTANWWDDIWLNEGFANYFQYFITDQIKPKWRMMERFVTNNLQAIAFVADSKNNSHAMSQERNTNKEIMDGFDIITYSKSGSVLRMISYVVGKEKFQTALQAYIKKNAFKSVKNDDLFTELEKVYKNNNLKKILENWVTVPGYPVITVKRNGENEETIITQSRFFDENEEAPGDKYWIPLNFVTENDLNFTDTTVVRWLDPVSNMTKINVPKNKFVIFNKQQFGYYRVNYDEKNWQMIIYHLNNKNHTDIHVLNRAQLIDDSLNLAKVGNLSYNIALSLIGYLKKETDYVPWVSAWREIENINKFVANTEFGPVFQNYVLEISENLVKEAQAVKSNETDHITKLKRIEALTWACKMGSSSCRSEATEKLDKWLNNPEQNAFSPDDTQWIICAGVRNANQIMWNKLWEKYLRENDTNILTALGCTSDIQILNGYLTEVVKHNKTKLLSSVLKAICDGSSEGINVVFNFITQKYENISSTDYDLEQFKSDFISIARRLTNPDQHKHLQEYIKNTGENIKDTANKALKIVENNLKNSGRRLKEFKVYFTKAPPSTDSSANVLTLTTIVLFVSLIISQIYS